MHTLIGSRELGGEPCSAHIGSDGPAMLGALLRLGIDCVDYPMLCLRHDRALWWANRSARQALQEPGSALQLRDDVLVWPAGPAWEPLYRAWREALRQGLRRLVIVGGERPLSISMTPLIVGAEPDDSAHAVLMMLGRLPTSALLGIECYARERGLTGAETRVLQWLIEGLQPREIASRQGVALSTVRTQLHSVRSKASASSLRELLRQVAALPPVPGRCWDGAAGARLTNAQAAA